MAGLSDLLKDYDLSPEEFDDYRYAVMRKIMESPQWKSMSPLRRQYIQGVVLEPQKPLLGMPKKGMFHPAVKTPMYLAHRFLTTAEPLGIYAGAARGGDMTPQQEAVEQEMWQRMGPQNRVARIAADIIPTMAGVMVPVTALGKVSATAKARFVPELAAYAKAGVNVGRFGWQATDVGWKALAIDMGTYGGGFGIFDLIRAKNEGKTTEEAILRGAKTAGITAASVGAFGAISQKLASLKPNAAPARAMARLLDAKHVDDVDDIARLARQEMAAAQTQALQNEWRVAGEAAEQAKIYFTHGVYPRYGGGPGAFQLPIASRWTPPAPKLIPRRIPYWHGPAEKSLGAAARNQYQSSLARYINQGGQLGVTQRQVAPIIQEGQNLGYGRKVYAQQLKDYAHKRIGGGRRFGETIERYRERVQRLDGDLRRAIEARHRILSDDIVPPPGTQLYFETPDQSVAAAKQVLDDIMPTLSKGEQEVVEAFAQAFKKTWDKANFEGAGLGLIKGYFSRMIKKPPNIKQEQFDTLVGQFVDDWLRPAEQSLQGMAGYARPGFFKHRMFEAWDDFVGALDDFNRAHPGQPLLEPLTDPVEVMLRYQEQMGNYLNWWKVVKETSQLVDTAGNPMISPAPITGWKKLLHPAFADMVGRTPKGAEMGFMPRGSVYGHPSLSRIINAYFAPPTQASDGSIAARHILNYYKQLLFWNPMIHGKNLLSDFLDEFNFRIPTMIKAHKLAGKAWATLDDAIVDAADHGLNIVGGWSLADWAGVDMSKIGGRLGRFLRPLNQAQKVNQYVLFDWMMRRAQVATYQMKVGHLIGKVGKMGWNVTNQMDSIKRAAAHFTNDLYGALPKNWFTATSYNMGTWGLLARNWTCSNIDLIAKAMAKRGLGSATLTAAEMGLIQGEYAKHIGKGLVLIAAEVELLTYAATKIFSEDHKGRHIWEYPAEEAFYIHTGAKDSKGREITYPVPLFAYIKDIIQWLPIPGFGKPQEVLYNKLHPVWKLTMDELTGYSHWQRRELVPQGASPLQAAGHRAAYLAEGAFPIARPFKHVITGSPQPGVVEPRGFPAFAYLTGGYIKHGRRGAADDPQLFDSLQKFRDKKNYTRLQIDEELLELIAKGDYDEYLKLAKKEGRYASDRYTVQKLFNYLCPTLAMWQAMRASDRLEWKTQAPPEEYQRLVARIAKERRRAQAIFLDLYRKRIGEWSPVKDGITP